MVLRYRHPYEPPVGRLAFVAAAALIVLLLLTGRLWAIQVVAGERYERLAEDTRTREITIPAPRGAILDRAGEPLVRNRLAPAVFVDRSQLVTPTGGPLDAQAEAILRELADLLEISDTELHDRVGSVRQLPWEPAPVALDLPPDRWFAIAERRHELPGVSTSLVPVRDYPQGTTAGHIVGYVAEISAEELADPRFTGYRMGQTVGRAGLEQTWERWLRGEDGARRIEVDAHGRIAGELETVDPVPGNDLHTSLDLELQRATERALDGGLEWARHVPYEGRTPPGRAGAAVVLDPRDGSILAMASRPGLDPARLAGRVDDDYWDELHDPAGHQPLVNRAIQGTYPPGSTFKLHVAASALDQGQISPTSRQACPPAYHVGRAYRNWNPRHEGNLDVAEALMRSCNTWFYPLTHGQWVSDQRRIAAGEEPVEAVQHLARRMGVGRRLGVDLPSEEAGVVPSRAWRRSQWERHRDAWCDAAETHPRGSFLRRHYRELCEEGYLLRAHEAINLAIGQGNVVASPLQLAASYATVANGGTLWRPHLGQRVTGPAGEVVHEVAPQALAELDLAPDALAALQRGLELVVMGRGTAVGAFAGFPLAEIPVAGKTGTATVPGTIPTSWFVGYAPADDPRYAVAVAVEEAGGGSRVAAPIARRILEAAHGLDGTPFPHETSTAG